ncbi:DNA double-strand break repair and VJ recombination protein [Niveomyces insectorum RCEF 264]|uniref:DNA double-strand break repair and VJ recombination protein n=1 Tax=Niveomyces insectorum RCEF 264 TaxID=1081102 RepID=A0A167X1B2_9HYPO|nr:DNA double-strand break repair and VJ recombination protein [Niveomyces insectorum RCEF 264]
MPDEASHVLKIPRSDEEGSFILARVSPSGPASRPFNAKVVATEGVAPYALTLRHDRIDKLRVKNAPCSADEWEHILAFLLLGRGFLDNVDATATVQEESTLTITVRKRVQNITQRLGTLSLEYDEDEGIELFEWCGEAVDSRSRAEEKGAKAAARQTELSKAVDDLKAQLDEFLEAKQADEAALLEKFCTLLNEKKLKIRLQQRLLASSAAKTAGGNDSQKRAAVEAEIKAEEDEVAGSNDNDNDEDDVLAPARRRGRLGKVGAGPAKRGAKRRAAASPDEAGSDSDEDAFEQAPAPAGGAGRRKGAGTTTAAAAIDDTDDGSGSDDEDDDGAASQTHSEEEDDDDDQTTEPDDVSTASDESEAMKEDRARKPVADKRGKAAAPSKPAKMGRPPKKPAAKAARAKNAQSQPEPEAHAPPPRRQLAFGKAKDAVATTRGADAAKQPAVDKAATNGSDSDSDDEL